jgi:hypothetical protein
MDWFDREMVRFVVRWIPFGGPPLDEVLPLFGITPAQLERRMNQILRQSDKSRTALTCEDYELLSTLRHVLPELSQNWRSRRSRTADYSARRSSTDH